MKAKLIFCVVASLLVQAGQDRAAAATRTWSGLGADALWSTPGNWVGSLIPAATNDLIFPSSSKLATVNNYLGAAHSITFGVGGYSISGATMVLTNGVNATNATGANVLASAVTLGANQSFTNLNVGTQLIFVTLDLAGRGATFRGAGTNQVANAVFDTVGGGGITNLGAGIFLLTGSNTFSGPTALSAGTNVINGFHRRSPITWTGGTLAGTGHLGQVTASGAAARQLTPGFGGTGIIEASNLVLNSSVTLAMQINGTNAGVDHDQIIVTNGDLTVGSATLNLAFLASLSPSFGTPFTLIKLPNAASAVNGTFLGLPEGSTFTNNNVVYELSYTGGVGNDVTLTASGYVSTGTTRFWTGAGTNNLWMNRTNWSGNIAPVPGDSLLFQTTASRTTNFSDFPDNTTFGSLRFTGASGTVLKDTLFGNAIRLNDGVRVETPSGGAKDATGSVVVSNRIGLNLSQTFTNDLDTDLRFAGGIDLGGNTLAVGVRGNTDIYFDAPVIGAGTLSLVGAGRAHLTASNAITGDVFVGSGLVSAEHAQALGSVAAGPVRIGTNGVLRLQVTNAVFTGSAIVLTGRLDVAASPNSGLAASIIVAGTNAELRVTNTLSSFTNFTLLGFVTNNLQLLNSGGGGFVRLAPAASIQGGGVLRNLGILDVDGTVHNVLVLGNNSISGNLSGAGQIDSLISTNFGLVVPGSASDATLAFDPLRVGTLVLGSSTTVRMDLFPNRPAGGATNKSFVTTNAPTLGNATLQITAITNLTPNQQFTILRNDSASPVTNTFKNLPEDTVLAVTNGNFPLRISYVGGTGNDVVLTVLSNTPPLFAAATTNLTISEIATLTYTNAVTDLERPPQTNTWTLLTPFSGLTLNPTNGALVWIPIESQGPSTNTVLVKVTDSGSPPLSSTGTVIVTILEFNQAPVPVPVPAPFTNLLAGNTVTMQLAATDGDIPANPLTWEPQSLLAGASVTASGLFTYTPGVIEVGLKTNRVRVFDFNADATNQKSFTNTLSIVVNVLMRRTVINTNDSGPGSLREAFLEVNTNSNGGLIDFSIPGAGPHKIAPLSQLPGLAFVTIVDGYTQTNSQPNTLSVGDNAVMMIELSGENIPSGTGIFWGGFNSGLGSTIRGLCINRFTNGVALNSGCANCGGFATGGSVVEGCFIGTDITGTFAFPNGTGIQYLNTYSSRIGGTDPSQRNVISGNMSAGIQPSQGFDGAFLSNLTIQNNYIGTDHTGTNALGNRFGGITAPTGGGGGFGFNAKNCLIADNVVAANGAAAGVGGSGVNWGGPTNLFLRNKVGIGADGVRPLGNAGSGFDIFTTDSTVGGTNLADANLIAYNGAAGVTVSGGTRNAILGNSVFGNTGLAIDLGGTGRTGNDAGDGDTGPNDLQNFPDLSAAVPAPGSITLSGVLTSSISTTYRIEFFHSPDFSPASQPQAKTFLGFTNVTTDGSGIASFSVTINQTVSGGFVTATATDPVGSTSEISGGLPFARLNVTRIGGQVRVLWLTNLTTFVLQSNANVAVPSGWSNVVGAPGVSGSNFFRDFPPIPSPRFFRLRSP
jgi:autotransporter-associated beta strand protein